jgi:hypothetical protein
MFMKIPEGLGGRKAGQVGRALLGLLRATVRVDEV